MGRNPDVFIVTTRVRDDFLVSRQPLKSIRPLYLPAFMYLAGSLSRGWDSDLAYYRGRTGGGTLLLGMPEKLLI